MVVAELYKFCLAVDKEFSNVLTKINGAKSTMEIVYLTGFRGRRLQAEGPKDKLSVKEEEEK